MTQSALALAAIFAVLLARRVATARQRRIAMALCLLFALDVIRGASLRFRVAPPYVGLARASWAISGVALFAWYATTAWVAWSALAGSDESKQSPRAEFDAWIAAVAVSLASVAGMFAAYPAIRGAPFLSAVRLAFALALAVQALAVARFASRGVKPDGPQCVALLLALSSLASAAGPWLFGDPVRDWWLARPISVVTFSLIAGVQLWMLLRRRTES